MKNYPKLKYPENYILSEDDFEKDEHFSDLLNYLTDIPASQPLHKISITNAGIYNQKTIIYIKDFENNKRYVPVLCNITLGVYLQNNRGTHSSRFITAINELTKEKYKNFDDFAIALARTVREKQKAAKGNAEVVGVHFQKRLTKKTLNESYDKLYLISRAVSTQDKTDVKIGLKAYNFTACPCTKTYTKYSVVPTLKSMGLNHKQINQILDVTLSGTHTQRGTITVIVDKEKSGITYKDLYNVLDKSAHLVYELLKRPDEHDLVVRALKKPQFTEDVARDVAFNAYQEFKNTLSPKADLYVESILNDSIHIHDVRSTIEKSLGEIENELK